VNTIVSETLAEIGNSEGPSVGALSGFGELYTEHSRAIFYLALRLLGDPQKAEDATHDVFLKAWRKLGQFRGESSCRTWLYRIAINHCHNLQQAWSNRNIQTTVDDALWETTPSQTDSPLRALETKELGERIQKTLDTLSPEYRLLLLLIADEELSYEQVGALTNQSADAVRGKLHRARKAFTRFFQQTA
jgi:RNA polymerase sigma-70 factor (ECF subfamily)